VAATGAEPPRGHVRRPHPDAQNRQQRSKQSHRAPKVQDRTLDVARAAAAAPRGLFSRVRVVIPAFSCMAALLAALLAATAGCCCWLLLLAAGCWLLAAGCWLLWLAVLVLAGGRAATDKAV